MWRKMGCSSAMPLPPRMSRPMRAQSKAIQTLLRFAIKIWQGFTLPAFVGTNRRLLIWAGRGWWLGWKRRRRSWQFCRSGALRRQRVVSVPGGDQQTRPLHAHFDVAIIARRLLRRDIAQRVLVAGLRGDGSVSAFNGLARVRVDHVSTGGVGVLGKNVGIALSRNVQLVELIQAGACRSLDSNGIDRDSIGQQHLQYLGIAGAAAVLVAITDDEDDLAVAAGLMGEFARRHQDGIVQHMRLARHGRYGTNSRIDRLAVDGRARERTSHDRRSGILPLQIANALQRQLQSLRITEVRLLVDGVAVGEYRDFVEGAERTVERRIGLGDFLEDVFRDAEVDHHCRRERKRIAGEKRDCLLDVVLVHAEVRRQQSIDHLAVGIFHRDRYANEVYVDLQLEEFVEIVARRAAGGPCRNRLYAL